MNTSSNGNHIISACANCGKGEEESVSLKNCVACKMVKYCSRDCQKAHCPQHKKECSRKRAAELQEEALFKQPSLEEDCPICFMRMPSLDMGSKYQACCGKVICSGCIHANIMTSGKNLCPFCRTPAPKMDEEIIKMLRKRVEVDDARAMYELGCCYSQGLYGLTQNRERALEHWHRAGELGKAASYYNIGIAYHYGRGVVRDEKKAKHYYELAAMRGNEHARYNLGAFDANVGNMSRALKHLMIAVGSGYHESLKQIKRMYTTGHATRDDYSKALKAYQEYLVEVKSDQRDEAAAFSEEFKYYE